MSYQKAEVLSYLDEKQIPYQVVNHPPVYTIEEMDQLDLPQKDAVVKNLFLREDKKKRFFLVVLPKDKSINVKELRPKLECRPLSFASESYLTEHLGLEKGAVTPFGILNDKTKIVEVIFDQDLKEYKFIAIHPNDNTATVTIKTTDVIDLIKAEGNKFQFLSI